MRALLSLVVIVLLGACASEEARVGELPGASLECSAIGAGDGFSNQSFAAQSGRFRIELTATPGEEAMDGVIGLSRGPVTRFSQLAAAVRFSPAGVIDVRSGAEYRADLPFPYIAGGAYRMRIDVDVTAHRYSVWVADVNSLGDYYLVANNYPFRTEQQSVTSLDAIAKIVDSSTGTLQLCEFRLQPTGGSGTGCASTHAGDGFLGRPINGGDTLVVAEAVVTPSSTDLDAVFGLSSGPPSRFSDLAVAVRFLNGVIDVRDGGAYRSDATYSYVPGTPYRVRIIADVATHIYSVQIVDPGQSIAGAPAWIYRFRTEQLSATSLGWFASVIDSPSGSIDICELGSKASSQLAYTLTPGGPALPVGAGEAWSWHVDGMYKLGPRGEKRAGPLPGGFPAIDPAGNLYIANAGLGSMTIRSFTPALVERWSRTYPTQWDAGIGSTGVNAFGDYTVILRALGTEGYPVQEIRMFTTDGALRLTIPYDAPAGTVGIVDRSGYTIGRGGATMVAVEHYNRNGGIEWRNVYPGNATVTAIAADPLGGIVFGGVMHSEMSFGGAALPLSGGEHQTNTYLASLAESGAHRFSRKVGISQIDGVATNGPRIAVSGRNRIDHEHMKLVTYDAAGQVQRQLGDVGLGEVGQAYEVAIGPGDHIYWDIGPIWHGPVFRMQVVVAP